MRSSSSPDSREVLTLAKPKPAKSEFVKVRVPERYGTFWAARGEGKPDVAYRGGEVALVLPATAAAYELSVLTDDEPAAAARTEAEVTAEAAAPNTNALVGVEGLREDEGGPAPAEKPDDVDDDDVGVDAATA